MKIYTDKCSSCHANDGSGATTPGKAMKVPDLRSAEIQEIGSPFTVAAVYDRRYSEDCRPVTSQRIQQLSPVGLAKR
jgi:cytochrome c